MVYLNLTLVVLLTSVWQVLFKWRAQYVNISVDKGFFSSLLKTLLDPYVLLGYICSFTASILWIVCLKKVPLSFAYPFLALPIIIVLLLSKIFFGEEVNHYKTIGAFFVVLGIIIIGMEK